MLICHREARHWEGKHPRICVSLCFVPTLITRLSLSPSIICSQSADLVAAVLTREEASLSGMETGVDLFPGFPLRTN